MRFLLLISLLGLPCPGQVTEEMTVIAREVRLHVLDRNGKPVRGLSADDLLVREDGAPRPLTFFQEVDLTRRDGSAAGESRASEVARRNMVIFLDTSNMTPETATGARESVAGVIDKLGPHDRVKLVQLEDRVVDLTAFTGDRQRLKLGLQKAAFRGVQRRELSASTRTISDLIRDVNNLPPEIDPEPLLRMIDQEVKQKERIKGHHYKTFLNALGVMAQALGIMQGSRSILVVSGGNYLETGGVYANTERLGRALNRMLNRNNVTVYSFLAATRNDRATNEMQMQGHIMNVHAMQDAGLIYGDLRKSENTMLDRPGKEAAGLDLASQGTGGFMERGTDLAGMSVRVSRVFDHASHYYRLGYMLEDSGKAESVHVQLKGKRPGVKLVYGRDIVPGKPYLQLDEASRAMTRRAMLLYSRETTDGLNASWRYHLNRTEEGFALTVFGRTNGASESGYEIGFSAFDAAGLPLDMITATTTGLPDRKYFTFSDVLLTIPPPAGIRCYLRNLDTGDFSLQNLAIPETKTTGEAPVIPQLIFATTRGNDVLPLNHLREEDKAGNPRVTADPLVVNNALFRTAFQPTFRQPEKISVLFHVENLVGELQEGLNIDFMLKTSAGARGVSGRIVQMERRLAAIRYIAEIEAADLSPDDYSLWVRVTKEGMQGALIKGGRFQIE
ncbi:MAG: VWA domain-containing protein [Acidobacteriota bacterium]|nr:VWA domain-containing protein [Acidobacteriota bacterium]